MSSPKGETFREECEPTLPQGSPKGDMSGSAVRRQRTKTRREGWQNHGRQNHFFRSGWLSSSLIRDCFSCENLAKKTIDELRQWRILLRVHFIETPIFTRQITVLLDDGDYRQLQVTLALKPAAGDLIRGSGGLRKIRWAVRGRGKSGGIRVIYYLVDEGEIYFLFAYAKNEQEDLDSRQLRVLRNLVKEEFE
jgi:hypothetical protein